VSHPVRRRASLVLGTTLFVLRTREVSRLVGRDRRCVAPATWSQDIVAVVLQESFGDRGARGSPASLVPRSNTPGRSEVQKPAQRILGLDGRLGGLATRW
jgi:hypothetical protein